MGSNDADNLQINLVKHALEYSSQPFIAGSADGSMIMWNRAFMDLTGFDANELQGMKWDIDLTPARWRSAIRKIIGNLLADKKPRKFEQELVRKDGTRFPAKILMHLLVGENTGQEYLYAFVEDMTDIRRKEDELRLTADLYQTIFESTGTAMMILEEDTTIYMGNMEMERMTGYTRENVVGMIKWTQFVAPESIPKMLQYHELRRKNPESAPNTYEFKLKTIEGGIRDIFITVSMIPGSKRSVVSLQDITERKKVEEEVQRYARDMELINQAITSANQAHDIQDLLDVVLRSTMELVLFDAGAIHLVDEARNVAILRSSVGLTSQAMAQAYEIPLSEAPYDTVFINGQPAFVERFIDDLPDTLTGLGFDSLAIIPFVAKDKIIGSLCLVGKQPHTFTMQEKNILMSLGREAATALGKMLAEAGLRESEERFRVAAESASDLIYEYDVNTGNIELFGNIQQITQLSGMDVPKRLEDWQKMIHFEDIAKVANELRDAMVLGRSCYLEYRVIRKDGEVRYWTDKVTPLFNEVGIQHKWIGVISDITERKIAEDKLRFLSLHDALTGLYNRTYFQEELRRLENSRDELVALIICDVDGLKLVNDTLGHDAGDSLLRAVANLIKDCFRGGDVVARVGGDEFAVLFAASTRSVVDEACRRIRSTVEEHNDQKPELPLSISIGYSIRTDRTVSMDDIYREADNNMYREKLHSRLSARGAIVETLMKALEARDWITEGHGDRLQQLVASIAIAIGLSERSIADLRLLAQFHDIGKVGIPDRILFKEDKLTSEESLEMQRHSEIGHRIATTAPGLGPIADWVLKHHEWWDGSGYPLGLKGEQIPLECRILAIADAYDAMTNDRPYRKAMRKEEAVKEIQRCSGTQFDPNLVNRFMQVIKAWR
ncbi:MAG: PAS domain S-box protein [Acidobacteriota bacterium]